MKRTIFILIVLHFCFAAGAQEAAPDSSVQKYDYGMEFIEGDPNGAGPFGSLIRLYTPRKRVELNLSVAGGGFSALAVAAIIPQRGLWDGLNGGDALFSPVRNLNQGQRNTLAGVTVAGGLLTTSMGLRFQMKATKKAEDPVSAIESSKLFPLLQAEFGAQKARDIVFARMVEGWNFKKIAERHFREPLRSKAVKMANEEYDRLSPDKAKFGTTIREQEATLDAKVGQIVMLRVALEDMKDGESKAAIEETIQFLRTEHRNAPDQGEASTTTANETHGNP